MRKNFMIKIWLLRVWEKKKERENKGNEFIKEII